MKKLLFTIIAVISAVITYGQQQNFASIRAVFPFSVENVILEGYWPSQNLNMMNTGPNEFEVQVNLSSNNDLVFNIKYEIVGIEGAFWVGAGNLYEGFLVPNRLDAHGMKYAKVFVNNQLISNLYTIRNWYGNGLDIAFKLNAYNGIVPFNDATHLHITTDDRIPTEAHHHQAYLNLNVPWVSDINIAGWIIAMSDNNYQETSMIEIDYMRVYGYDGADSVLLCNQNYDSYDPFNDGGLYMRYPFFPPGYDDHDPLPATVNGGIVSFYTSEHRLKVPHLWTERHYATNGYLFDGYKLHCRARITGHALAQVGIDFRNAMEQVHELGVSSWYFHGNGLWQDIIFDSRTFVTSVRKPEKETKSIEVFLNHAENYIDIKYSNLIPGKWILQLYNNSGQLFYAKEITISMPDGYLTLPFEKTFPLSATYNFSSREDRLTGKIKLN